MALSCSDTCDLLMQKLLDAGFKINPKTQGQDRLYAALETCTILPSNGEVQIVVQVLSGVVDDVWAFTKGEMADKKQAERDADLEIVRDEEGRITSENKDFVGTFVITVNQFENISRLP